MGFIGGLLSAAAKTVATPIVIVVDIATFGKANITKRHIKSIRDDIEDALMNSDSFL